MGGEGPDGVVKKCTLVQLCNPVGVFPCFVFGDREVLTTQDGLDFKNEVDISEVIDVRAGVS